MRKTRSDRGAVAVGSLDLVGWFMLCHPHMMARGNKIFAARLCLELAELNATGPFPREWRTPVTQE